MIVNMWPCDGKILFTAWRLGVHEYFLSLWAEASLNVAALAELARMQRSTALGVGRMLVY
jgi:hypothetical protein